MRLSIFLPLVTVGLLMANGAFAQADGPYVGIAGGGNFPRTLELDNAGISSDVDFKNNWAGAVTLGYGLGNGLRVEGELTHRQNDVDSISSATNGTGDLTANSVMANLLYDFWSDQKLSPYVGVGIGLSRFDSSFSPIGATTVNDKDTHPAIQGILGVSYRFSESAQVFADYRYFHSEDIPFDAATGAVIDGDYGTHTVMVGVRFFFGGPKKEAAPAMAKPEPKPAAMAETKPAAPPPPKEPEKRPEFTRSYLVFFGWDRADLSDEAMGVLRAAADTAQKIEDVTRINVTGHADRSGPAAYNVGLSQRRAKAVADELVRLGVPLDQIVVLWKEIGRAHV